MLTRTYFHFVLGLYGISYVTVALIVDEAWVFWPAVVIGSVCLSLAIARWRWGIPAERARDRLRDVVGYEDEDEMRYAPRHYTGAKAARVREALASRWEWNEDWDTLPEPPPERHLHAVHHIPGVVEEPLR